MHLLNIDSMLYTTLRSDLHWILIQCYLQHFEVIYNGLCIVFYFDSFVLIQCYLQHFEVIYTGY